MPRPRRLSAARKRMCASSAPGLTSGRPDEPGSSATELAQSAAGRSGDANASVPPRGAAQPDPRPSSAARKTELFTIGVLFTAFCAGGLPQPSTVRGSMRAGTCAVNSQPWAPCRGRKGPFAVLLLRYREIDLRIAVVRVHHLDGPVPGHSRGGAQRLTTGYQLSGVDLGACGVP